MTLRGVIENGRLCLESGVGLPNGTVVDVIIRRGDGGASTTARRSATALSKLARHALSTGIFDLADEHDHHAYGSPKRPKKRAVATRKAKPTKRPGSGRGKR